MASPTERDWLVRLEVYRWWIAHGRPPVTAEIAAVAGIAESEALATLRRLHNEHALLLDGKREHIRIANPLSAVATPYRVQVGDRWYFANCAWDSLGIPAMLHVDALVQAEWALTAAPVQYAVTAGQLDAPPALVHFLLPFERWYDDLVHT